MDPVHAVALALVQGFTEFLPVSSSAHLVLLPLVASWPDQGLAFDVAVHVGTLAAVVAYFRREVLAMARDLGRPRSPDGRLAWMVAVGTVPAGLAGAALTLAEADWLRSAGVIAAATIVFGLALGWADRRGGGPRTERDLTWRDAVVIGCAQALALVPGTSRSGITLTAGLALGLGRAAAARFSFLLSIPIIALAGAVKTLQAIASPAAVPWGAIALGIAVSGTVAYLTIGWFLALLERVGLMPFVIYRLALGAALVFLLVL